MTDFSVEISGKSLEYIDNGHIYIVDGIVVPSITKVLGQRFRGRYDGIPAEVLERAARAGTAVHEAIEWYIATGCELPLPEVEGFRLLQEEQGFKVVDVELPVILSAEDGTSLAAGRLDLVLEKDGKIGGADIKRTCRLDVEYLTAQLNLYRIAYRQSYSRDWGFLAGLHLRESKRKWVDIEIDPESPEQIINKYFKEKEQDEQC